ncbi:MAG: DUF3368 domain-containing protein [Pontiellaceae bacterium]|nr:DUF3368 domain-containing protein [Pontiellaceae bacterium]
MIIIADAAPLIFLAKLNRLQLMRALFGPEIYIPSQVAEEILRPPLPPGEELLLQRFIDAVSVINTEVIRNNPQALSIADFAVHQLAVERNADLVLSDDKLLRSLLIAEGIRPTGTLGILIHAVKKNLQTKETVRKQIDTLIRQYHFRISIELYEHILEILEQI